MANRTTEESGFEHQRHPNSRYLTAAETAACFHVGPRTPENWAKKKFIHTFVDQHGVIRYDPAEIEVGFEKFGPRRMRDGRKKYGRPVIAIVIAEGGEQQ